METLLIIVHIFVSIVLIVAVLLQAGRGGGMGATFGGASQQIFGGRGAGTFLAKVTTGMAVVFFLTSLTLSMISSRERSDVARALERTQAEATETPAEEQPAEAAEAAEQPAEAAEQPAETAEQPAETAEQPAEAADEAQPEVQPAPAPQPGEPEAPAVE